MNVTVYSISRDKTLNEVSIAEFDQQRENPQSFFWIDVLGPERTELTELLSSLAVHPLIADRCMDPEAAALVASYPDTVFIHFPTMDSWDNLERSFLSIVCLPRAIVTISQVRLDALDGLASNFAAAIGKHDPGTAAIVYLIMDELIDETTACSLKARRVVDRLEESIGEAAQAEQLSRRILAVKRAVAHFEIGAEEQHRCVAALLSLENDSFSARALGAYFHDALSHLDHVLRYVERIEGRLSELDQHNLLVLQDRTNRRLKILTVLSAIFMPLTLITGIYGMNFQYMPELTWRYGYLFVLLLMAALATGLGWFFYRRNWFK